MTGLEYIVLLLLSIYLIILSIFLLEDIVANDWRLGWKGWGTTSLLMLGFQLFSFSTYFYVQ